MSRIAAIAVAGFLTAASYAATFTVNTTADTIDILPGNGVAADAAGNTSLRAAIMEANADGGADDIVLPAGTFTLSGANDDDLGISGDIDILSNLTLTGAGAGLTIIDANNIDRVIDVGNGAALLSGLTIRNGLVQGAGAGIRIGAGTSVTITNCDIGGNDTADNNNAAGGALGGGIFIEAAPLIGGGTAGSLTLSNSTIAENTCNDVGVAGNTEGGGIFNGGNLTIRNTTISGNVCTGANVPGSNGGGIASSAGTVTIQNSTIAANSARGAGGNLFRGGGTLTVQNSIISGGLGGPTNCGGTITSQGFNISDDGSCGLNGSGDLADTDPLLGELADNGGPTRTHLPTAESPAIDGGDDDNCQGTDQRGIMRPQQQGCDVGAVEVTPVDGSGAAGDDTDNDGIGDDFDGDGQPDDADNDGAPDAEEDENNNGVPDGLDDTDSDGTPDAADPDQQGGDNGNDNNGNDNNGNDNNGNDNNGNDNNGNDNNANDNNGNDNNANGNDNQDNANDNDAGMDGLDDTPQDCGECGNGADMLLLVVPFSLVGAARRRRRR
ncbi:hypothetical protein RAS1_34540 [Phycisphaerae bacterium RAS1]|nr:hypothetical protein RAS1_34540 [Phycisphaerae bacterium RAS1]